MNIQPQYAWLANEPAPKVLIEGLRTLGTLETPGTKSNPTILAWAREVGIAYGDDSIPWCGLWMAVIAKRAGYDPVSQPLWAANWARWGNPAERAMLGDVLVFRRNGGGHVGIYVAEDTTAYHVLGGNQSDSVNITRILKSRCTHIRRSPWRVGQPANVRTVNMLGTGVISTNEA